MVAIINTIAPIGFDGSVVEVESDLSNSLPALQIVGLGNKAIDEARERVKSAITNSQLDFPRKRIIINLAPAELPKDGTHYDLPIALAILVASGQIRQREIAKSIFAGELALDGNIRPIKGAINIAQSAKESGFEKVFLPYQNANQARLIRGISIIGVKSLKELYLHLKQEVLIQETPSIDSSSLDVSVPSRPYLDDIQGQEQAKRALLIAAAGHHNILLSGTPGAGKTMLAKTLANLLPPLSTDESIAVTKIHSIAGKVKDVVVTSRPFRSPHHTASSVALIGGGNQSKPGEVSLAHTGVLFLDEIPEFPRSVLEALRQPLEDKTIEISRANTHATYPADFMLIATMNPCPCGYYGDNQKQCTCTSVQVINYQKKLSGPLLDRIDMRLTVARVPSEAILGNSSLQNTQHISAQQIVKNVHDIQLNRYGSSTKYNSSLNNSEITKYAPLDEQVRRLLLSATDKLGLSTRSYYKIIKIARTIADISGDTNIKTEHISEALQYRR